MSKLTDTIADILADANMTWWGILIFQVATGIYLFSQDAEFGKLLLSSAFGQGATATIGAKR